MRARVARRRRRPSVSPPLAGKPSLGPSGGYPRDSRVGTVWPVTDRPTRPRARRRRRQGREWSRGASGGGEGARAPAVILRNKARGGGLTAGALREESLYVVEGADTGVGISAPRRRARRRRPRRRASAHKARCLSRSTGESSATSRAPRGPRGSIPCKTRSDEPPSGGCRRDPEGTRGGSAGGWRPRAQERGTRGRVRRWAAPRTRPRTRAPARGYRAGVKARTRGPIALGGVGSSVRVGADDASCGRAVSTKDRGTVSTPQPEGTASLREATSDAMVPARTPGSGRRRKARACGSTAMTCSFLACVTEGIIFLHQQI